MNPITSSDSDHIVPPSGVRRPFSKRIRMEQRLLSAWPNRFPLSSRTEVIYEIQLLEKPFNGCCRQRLRGIWFR